MATKASTKYELIQATSQNGIWDKLRASWDKELKSHSAPQAYAKDYLDHAEKIVGENGEDKRYGIYVACGRGGRAPFDGFVHVNHKLIRTSAAEIRLVWNKLAPRFQFSSLKDEVADIQTTFLVGALDLSKAIQTKPPVKMFLGNEADIAFGTNFAQIANRMPGSGLIASMKGSWLHLAWAKK